ncbi:hypothetical protein IWW39_002266 [Coemansia spiralis]|uniref:DNA/RNA-binding protein Alba-like domain-containing protein n=1 Tax=Coemansia spiralis TaxID=417178 RepID=A0A9W8GNI3_9FUNG|nr:hypothetical protein IWW39_002266 [Coemansia spiralis]
MKNRQKKSKYAVSVDSAAEQATSATASTGDTTDIRITTHGKIRNYAEYINGSLQAQPKRSLFIYAQGAAICKLVTVLEIVKRDGHTGLTQSLTIGDSVDSPCARRAKNMGAESTESCARGMYSSALSKAFSQTPSTEAIVNDAPKSEPVAEAKQPGEPWMLVELRCA